MRRVRGRRVVVRNIPRRSLVVLRDLSPTVSAVSEALAAGHWVGCTFRKRGAPGGVSGSA
eukprot:ctg_5849.g699